MAHYFNCLFKYTQIAVWLLRFLNASLIKDGAIAPTASLSGDNTKHLMAMKTSFPKGDMLDIKVF